MWQEEVHKYGGIMYRFQNREHKLREYGGRAYRIVENKFSDENSGKRRVAGPLRTELDKNLESQRVFENSLLRIREHRLREDRGIRNREIEKIWTGNVHSSLRSTN